MAFATIVCDNYNFISTLDQTLAELVDMHLYPTQSGIEEITYHSNHRFAGIHSGVEKFPPMNYCR